jgi:hypothetical protein
MFSSVAGALQPVDTLFVNFGEKKTFFVSHSDTITSGYMWFVNDTLKKDSAIYINNISKKEDVMIFTDSVIHDYKLTVVPISKKLAPVSNSRILGDTFNIAVKILNKIDNHLNASTTSPQPLCFTTTDGFDTIVIVMNLINHKPTSQTEKFKIIYSLDNLKTGLTVLMDTIVSLEPLKLTLKIDSRKIGHGNFSLNIKQLYYGRYQKSHIDYTVKSAIKGSNPVSVIQSIQVGLKPVIGKIKAKN